MMIDDYKCEKCNCIIGKTICDGCGVEIKDDMVQYDIEQYGGDVDHIEYNFCSKTCLVLFVEDKF